MRKLSPAYVVTSVVLAVAGTAVAQASATAATRAPASTISNGTNSAQRTVQSGAPVANPTTGSTVTTNTSSGDGSRSGNNTDSSSANAATGSTSTATTTNQGSIGAGNGLAPGVTHFMNPALINSTVTADGEIITDGSSQNLSAAPRNNGSTGASIDVEMLRSSDDLDRAIKAVKKDRKKIGRNGQLLQSIAPRTNVDRTGEMPDDGATLALTGSSSALTRR